MESDIAVCPHCGAAVKMPANRDLQCVCEYCKSVLREGMTPKEWDTLVSIMKERYRCNVDEEMEYLKKTMERWRLMLLFLLVPVLSTVLVSLFMG